MVGNEGELTSATRPSFSVRRGLQPERDLRDGNSGAGADSEETRTHSANQAPRHSSVPLVASASPTGRQLQRVSMNSTVERLDSMRAELDRMRRQLVSLSPQALRRVPSDVQGLHAKLRPSSPSTPVPPSGKEGVPPEDAEVLNHPLPRVVRNGQSKASTNDKGGEEISRSSAGSGGSQIPVSAAPQSSGRNPMHTWGSGSLPLMQGCFSRLVTDKLLCKPCEKVANDVANEIAEQKLGLLQRARSLLPPSTAPPEPPELKPVPGYHSAAPASLSPSHQAAPISPNRHSRCSFRGSQRVLSPGQTQPGDDEFYFPYSCEWDAGPVHMKDIMEDGMPPDQRASDIEHLRLSITVKSANHLPKADAGFGKCDPYIELRFFDQKFRTKTHKMTYDAFFEETFSLFVHAENAKQAALETDADRAHAMGLAVEFECFDFDLFGANDSIGTTTLLLKDLLDHTQDFGSESTLERHLKRHGQSALGADGKQTSITISCKRVELDAKRPRLGVVTLESCLAQSDGALAIVCSRQTLCFGDESDAKHIGVGAKTVKARFRRSSSFFSESSLFKQNKEKDKNTASRKKSAAIQSLQVEDEEDRKIPDDEIYWREWLEKFLESLTINILVMLLVFIDVINVLVTLLSQSLEETETQAQITYFVLGCFLVELSTRMLAQGRRFFQNYWNIFDVIIIYASVAFAAAQYYITHAESTDGTELGDARQATTSLRILSRAAMALRVIRVVSHARKIAKLRGTMSRGLRTAVSQNKRRFVRNGFDLDLTYITDRIIAMSAPALGEHKAYRNDGHVVSRFLSLRHYGSFFIFNLCDTCLSSDGVIGNYHPQMFFNQVQRIPFEDHGPPLLLELIHFCREATKWLRRDPANIMAVHCKGGKGRTGIMIAAFMLWCGHRKCAMDAMELFTFRRTENYDPDAGVGDESSGADLESAAGAVPGKKRQPNRGVDGPSQQRYVFYIEAMLYCGIKPLESTHLWLSNIRIPIGAPQLKAWWISYTVKCQRTPLIDSFIQHKATSFGGPLQVGQELVMPAGIFLDGDTKIEIFRHKNSRDSKRKLLLFVVFHPGFYRDRKEIVFTKKKIDMLHKDGKNKLTDADFKLTLMVEQANVNKDSTTGLATHLDLAMQNSRTDESDKDGNPRITSSFCTAQAAMQQCFRNFGFKHTVLKGEYVLDGSSARCMMLIESGEVECVVTAVPHHTAERGEHRRKDIYHPCGMQIPDEGLMTVRANTTRVPVNMVFGRGCTIGFSNFVSSPGSLHYRARTDVTVIVVAKSAHGELACSWPRDGQSEVRIKLSRDVEEGRRQGEDDAQHGADYGGAAGSDHCPFVRSHAHQDHATARGREDGSQALWQDSISELASLHKGADVPEVESPSTSPHDSPLQVSPASPAAKMWASPLRKFSVGKSFLKLSASPGQRKAWLVRKRLNLVQTWWRVLIVDAETQSIINTIPHGLEETHLSNLNHGVQVPSITHEEMIHGKSTVRKTLDISSISAVISHSDSSLAITLKFNSAQRPYQIEFLDKVQRDDFCAHLTKFLGAHSTLVFRKLPTEQKAIPASVHARDWRVGDVDEGTLAQMWQGMAINLSNTLERARTESIRISRLKALTDQASLMLFHGESEQLRLGCIKKFSLPSNEQINLHAKCFLSSDEQAIHHKHPSITVGGKRLRVIVLSDNVVFDPASYGPSISPGSFIFRLDQLYQVYDPSSPEEDNIAVSASTFRMKVLLDGEQGSNNSLNLGAHEIVELTLAFKSAENGLDVRRALEGLCKRAATLRIKQKERPLNNPLFENLIKRFGLRHKLKQGQEFRVARVNDSLFIVEKGSISLSCDKEVYKLVRQGASFGETNFAKGHASAQFDAHAGTEAPITEVVELKRSVVLYAFKTEEDFAPTFWFLICKILDAYILEVMESTFPGTWSESRVSRNNIGSFTVHKAGHRVALGPV